MKPEDELVTGEWLRQGRTASESGGVEQDRQEVTDPSEFRPFDPKAEGDSSKEYTKGGVRVRRFKIKKLAPE